MGNVSDEKLMAYADGELGQEECAVIAAAITADPALQGRLDVFVETADQMACLFNEPMLRPVPDELIDTILGGASPVAPRTEFEAKQDQSRVGFVDFLQGLLPVRGSFATAAMALGLTLVAGGAIGWQLNSSGQKSLSNDTQIVAFDNGKLVARGGFKTALDTAASGVKLAMNGGAAGPMALKPVFTFRSVKNEFCRQYELTLTSAKGGSAGKGYSGVACRGKNGSWVIPVHVAAAPHSMDSSATVPASGAGNPVVDKVVDQLIDGDVMDVADEAKLIISGWQSKQ